MRNILMGISLVWITMSCNSKEHTREKILAARQAAIDSVNQVIELERVKQATIDSMNLVLEQEREAEAQRLAAKAERAEAYRNSYVADSYVPVSQTRSKKKMNNATKGALIGAGVGALTGVAVSKNKGKGALIGAGVGAGAGALTGVVVDKQKKKKP